MIEHLKLQHYQKMPWKNGLGFTFEIARRSQDGVDDFDWRISMADVEHNSEFSFFKGKQRIISVLSGVGMYLYINQTKDTQIKDTQINEVNVSPRTIFAFDGEERVSCKLINGAIRDLNLIYQKERVHPRMQWIIGNNPETILTSAQEVLIFNMAQDAVIKIADCRYKLETLDCLKIVNLNQVLAIKFPENVSQDCCIIELF